MEKRIILSILLLIVLNAFFALGQQIEKQILNIPGKQEGPLSVYGRYIVYMQEGNVWLHDAGELFKQDDDVGSIQLTKDGIGDKYTFPVIDRGNGRQVAWISGKEDIYVYDIKTKETKKLNLIEGFEIEDKGIEGGIHSQIVSDNQGGAIVAWVSDSRNVYVEFIDSQGNSKKTFQLNGQNERAEEIIAMAPDGKGGAIVGWTRNDEQIFINFIDGTGPKPPISISEGEDYILTSLTSDGQGGVIAAWLTERDGIGVGFRDSTGSVKTNVRISGIFGIPAVTSDNQGGAIVTWLEIDLSGQTTSKMFATFIDSQGNLGNNILIDDTGITIQRDEDIFIPSIVSDGNGGAVIAYRKSDGMYVKFLRSDRSLSDAFKVPDVDNLNFYSSPALVSDSQGGAILAFSSGGGIQGGTYFVTISSNGNMGDPKIILPEIPFGDLRLLSVDKSQDGLVLSWVSQSREVVIAFVDLQNDVKRFAILPREFIRKRVSRDFQPTTKENLAFYNGILAWDQNDLKYNGRDIRGYNLNEPGEPNRIDPQDKHYFFLTGLETVKIGNSEFQLNEIKPVLSKDSISFIGDSVRDLGDFGADISQELYRFNGIPDFNILTQDTTPFNLMSRQEDGCNVLEASVYREYSALIWTEFCSPSTFKIRKDTEQPIAISDTSTFYSPLVRGNEYYYVEKQGNEFLLKSNNHELIKEATLQLNSGEKKTFSIDGTEHEIEFLEMIDAQTTHIKLKIDGVEEEFTGEEVKRIGDLDIGRFGRAEQRIGTAGAVVWLIQIRINAIYPISGTSIDADNYRFVYEKDEKIGAVIFPELLKQYEGNIIIVSEERGGAVLGARISEDNTNNKFMIQFLNGIGDIRFQQIFSGSISNLLPDHKGGVFVTFENDNGDFVFQHILGDGTTEFTDPLPLLKREEKEAITDSMGSSGGAGSGGPNNWGTQLRTLNTATDGEKVAYLFLAENWQERWGKLYIAFGKANEPKKGPFLIFSYQQPDIGETSLVVTQEGALFSFTTRLEDWTVLTNLGFVNNEGNLRDFSGGKFPALEEAAKFIRADIDNSGILDITDAITLLGYLFQAGKEPTCLDAADVDDSGILDLTDAIYLLQRLFQGGAEIPEPRALGVDSTSDGLDCKCYGASC